MKEGDHEVITSPFAYVNKDVFHFTVLFSSCLQNTSRRQTVSLQRRGGGDPRRVQMLTAMNQAVGSVGTDRRPSMQAERDSGKQSGRAQE